MAGLASWRDRRGNAERDRGPPSRRAVRSPPPTAPAGITTLCTEECPPDIGTISIGVGHGWRPDALTTGLALTPARRGVRPGEHGATLLRGWPAWRSLSFHYRREAVPDGELFRLVSGPGHPAGRRTASTGPAATDAPAVVVHRAGGQNSTLAPAASRWDRTTRTDDALSVAALDQS